MLRENEVIHKGNALYQTFDDKIAHNKNSKRCSLNLKEKPSIIKADKSKSELIKRSEHIS